MSEPMTPERLAEIRAAHDAGEAFSRLPINEQLVRISRGGDGPGMPHVANVHRHELLSEVARLTEERDAYREKRDAAAAIADGAIDYAQREVSDYDRVVAERDAARAELAGLRQRLEGLVDLLDAGNWPWDGGVPAHWEEEPLTHRMADVLRAAVHDDPPESGGSCPDGQIVICGSVSQAVDLADLAATFRSEGLDVLCPEPSDRPAAELNAQWLTAIETARMVAIVRKADGSLGPQTTTELGHALDHGREVVLMTPPLASPDAVTTSPPWCDLTVSDLHNDEAQHPCAHRAVCEAFTVSGEWTPACERHASEYSPGRRREFGSTAEPVLGEIPPRPDAVTEAGALDPASVRMLDIALDRAGEVAGDGR